LCEFTREAIRPEDRVLVGLILVADAMTLQAQATAEQTKLMEAIAQNAPGLGYTDVFPDEREEELD
jgi:hypothetical protein